ncbi:MAG: diacylglycerol kinase family protein, partial [Myxococcota bacterium]|nr:diacylglycerol kinase family protein [Myxococcota bacterium]
AMRIGLLSNLHAGRNREGLAPLRDAVAGRDDVVCVETLHADAVPDALHELARRDVELLVVNGGDGTLMTALTAILHEGAFDGRVPLIAPLRGGRTNTNALDVGASRSPVRALETLVRAARDGSVHERVVERRVLKVDVRDGFDREVRYGMFFGAGVIHRGTRLVHRSLPHGQQGVFGASLVTGALLARLALGRDAGGLLAPDKVRIFVDGESVERGESRLVMATTLDRLFLKLRPFWGEGSGGVRLTAISADARGFGRALPRILAGRPNGRLQEENGYLSRNADQVVLAASCGLMVDGELIDAAPERVVSLSADTRVHFVGA